MKLIIYTQLYGFKYGIWWCIRRALISAGQIEKKKLSTNIKHDEINIMNIINDNTYFAW